MFVLTAIKGIGKRMKILWKLIKEWYLCINTKTLKRKPNRDFKVMEKHNHLHGTKNL